MPSNASSLSRAIAGLVAVVAILALSACATVELTPALQPLSKDTLMLLGQKGMEVPSPVFIRIFKEESQFEVWKQRKDGRFHLLKTYPICNWSGDLGPKVVQGDRQSPEGFYTIGTGQMNPDSHYYLAFNIGFPNAYDRANKRTGDNLMIHGKCKSAGCYAMTDALIEEIYALAREAYAGGQSQIQVHALPFRMTDANMARHRTSPWLPFWKTLKEGYDYFETTHLPPDVVVCQRQYFVNVKQPGGAPFGRLDPEAACPAMERGVVSPFVPEAVAQLAPPSSGQPIHAGAPQSHPVLNAAH